MSRNSPITRDHRWIIGEDRTFTFRVVSFERVVTAAAIADGAVLMNVDPLEDTLASADRVRFGKNLVATLAEAGSVGETALDISAFAGVVGAGVTGYKVQNLTGFTMEWVLREAPGGGAALLTIAAAITDAANGICTVTIADTDTENLAPGTLFHTLRRTNAGFESALALGDAVLQQAATR
jgi:hypothetical protein